MVWHHEVPDAAFHRTGQRDRAEPLTAAAVANANSVLSGLAKHGATFGLDQPHRLAQFIAQIMHESGAFRYDREVWGPTEAQKRYDTRTDLGNTAALDGDDELYAAVRESRSRAGPTPRLSTIGAGSTSSRRGPTSWASPT